MNSADTRGGELRLSWHLDQDVGGYRVGNRLAVVSVSLQPPRRRVVVPILTRPSQRVVASDVTQGWEKVVLVAPHACSSLSADFDVHAGA